ncbi:MAG: protein translocase subunit SecD [Deltaproteobacteria bacterium]|nr:protein translocase subunit SecD [Deltaproteobacteria bacterium]
MDRGWITKLGIVIALTVAAVWMLFPTYVYFSLPAEERNDATTYEKAVPSWMRTQHLTLGLDLQGGIHLVMGVEVEKAVMDRVQRRVDEITSYAKDKEIAHGKIKADVKEPLLRVELTADQREQFESEMLGYFQDMTLVTSLESGLELAFTADTVERIRTSAVDQAVKTIRNRVDQWGVTEPQIIRRGEDQILIQLPGEKDPERAKGLLGKTAQLEFRITQDHQTGFLVENQALLPEGVTLKTDRGRGPEGEVATHYLEASDRRPLDQAKEALLPHTPEGTTLAFQKIPAPDGTATYRTYLLTAAPGITGDYLVDARVATDSQQNGRPYVAFEFDQEGARIFGELTEANVNRFMAVVLDNMVESAPVIQSKITNRGQITLGSYKSNQDLFIEANDLALVLKAGALPAPVRILEERTVGATLGPDLIRRGLFALMMGGILVLLFMPLYYKASGLVANLTLVLNVLFLLAMLSAIGATLTLPGIAGIVLTVGMAVDANVIIFERIREEIEAGKTAWASIQAGYEQAFSAILDGNVTTGIAALVLLQYGSGPIKGFAVTLFAGILSTLFTAYYASRVFQEGLNRNSKTVSV